MEPTPETEARFEALVRGYGRLIRSIVYRIGGKAAAVHGDDIEQRVHISLWKQIRSEQTIQYPSSYIYKAAVRETIRVIQEERQRTMPPPIEEAVSPLATRATAEDPHEALLRREESERIAAALAALPDDRQRAVRAHLAGFSVDEIMKMYDWPYQKARNLIARGTADLRQALRPGHA